MDKKLYTILQPDTSRAVRYAAGDSEYPEAKGKIYKKRIINFGEYADQWFPEYFLHLDEAWGESVLQNFKAKTVGRVYVPASHTDDPDKNRGEVIDMFLSEDGKGIDAILDIRDEETVEKIDSDLIWDVSIGFTMNWITKDGDEKGPAIYHVALVNNPYIEDMTPFEAFAKLTSECREDVAKTFNANAIMLSRSGIKKEFSMEDEKVKLINDKEFPVEVTFKEGDEDKTVTVEAGAEVEVPADQKEAVEALIADAVKPEDSEEEEEETAEQKAAREAKEAEDAEAESDKDKELAAARKQIQEYRKKEVDQLYTAALKAGKIVPAQEKAFKALALAGDTKVEFSAKDGKTTQLSVSELLKEFTKNAPKLVNYSEEGNNNGSGKKKVEGQTPYDTLTDEAKAGLKATGVSKERYNENVEKHPEMYPQHSADSSSEEEENNEEEEN